MKKIGWLFAVLCLNAHAANSLSMVDAAMTSFDDDDWVLFTAGVKKALEEYKDGTQYTWKNAKTHHWGVLSPSHSTFNNHTHCRELTIINHAGSQKGEMAYRFCKFKDKWKLV